MTQNVEFITPKEFLQLSVPIFNKMKELEGLSDHLYALAIKCPPPKHLRPAQAADIRVGEVIWYPESGDSVTPYWFCVDKVLSPQDDWKAYTTTDGARRGLRGAFVEISNSPPTHPTDPISA